jgi:hypothetical protein
VSNTLVGHEDQLVVIGLKREAHIQVQDPIGSEQHPVTPWSCMHSAFQTLSGEGASAYQSNFSNSFGCLAQVNDAWNVQGQLEKLSGLDHLKHL